MTERRNRGDDAHKYDETGKTTDTKRADTRDAPYETHDETTHETA